MEFWMCLRILFQFKGCVKTYQEQSSEEKSSEEAIIPADEKGPTGVLLIQCSVPNSARPYEELRVLGNSSKLPDQLLVYFDMETQREAQLANELSNLIMQLLQSVNERRTFIEELERLPEIWWPIR
ncbi:hypothetical protein Tco_1430053 [Tanacetum coccineum]